MTNRRQLLFAACALLAGCTTLSGPAGTQRWSGRFSLRAATAEKTETAAGKYRLTVTGDVKELEILSPVNGVLGRVTVTPSEARVERGNQPVLTAPTETILMQEAFGFDLPIAIFTSWLDGVPSPAESFEKTGRSFTQAGWFVTHTLAAAPSRPAILKLTRSDPGRTLSITLTVEKEVVPTTGVAS